MDKTKIEWCTSTWNPVTGCLHGCEYCYARVYTKRFGKNLPDLSDFASKNKGLHLLDNRIDSTPYPFGFEPTFHAYRLNDYVNKKGRNIFVCSMADLFGSWVPDNWIEEVFAACEKAPQHKYLFLTKNPQRYVDFVRADKLPIRNNMWYGTSVTNADQMERVADTFGYLPATVKTFFSIEPILEDIAASNGWINADNGSYANWIILGAETGRRKEIVVPEREWIEKITTDCDDRGIPLFMKDSLLPIIGEKNMRREFPRDLRR